MAIWGSALEDVAGGFGAIVCTFVLQNEIYVELFSDGESVLRVGFVEEEP